MTLDLTAYMWRLERKDDLRVRLLMYVAPGLGSALARALQERGFRARTRAATCVAVDVPADLHRLLAQLGAQGRLLEAAEAYARAYAERPSQFQELNEDQRRARRHAAAALMRFGPSRSS